MACVGRGVVAFAALPGAEAARLAEGEMYGVAAVGTETVGRWRHHSESHHDTRDGPDDSRGAWQLAAGYGEIGRTGSAGLASPFAVSIELVRVMLVGAGLALLLLGLAVVIAVRRPSQSGLSTASTSSGATRWLGAVGVIIVA